MINQFERYGKRNQLFLLYNEIKYRFKINPFTEYLFSKCAAKPYVTPINKLNFGIATATSVALIPAPGPFDLIFTVPLMRWGLK